jgi:dolichol-phosphate mannosyltransferase
VTAASTFAAPAAPLADLHVSVVAYVRNDAAIIESFVRETTSLLAANYENYELILVDDGSTDETVARVKPLLAQLEAIRVLKLSRHFGQDIAFTAGLESAIGDYVLTMRAEWDPPELLPRLVELARSENAVVLGTTTDRRGQGLLRRLAARVFYWSTRRLFRLPIPPDATQLRVLHRQAVNAVIQIRDTFRYLRAFMPHIGFDTRIYPYRPVSRSGRAATEPFLEALIIGIGVIVTNSAQPLRFVSLLGLAGSFLNLLYIGYIVAIYLFKDRVAEGWVTLSFQNASMFFLLFVMLTVLTEYIGRILSETRDRPLYYVQQELNSSVVIPEQRRRNVVTGSA